MKRMVEIMLMLPAAALALPVLVDSALKGAVLMALVLGAVLLMRGAPAALRHMVLVAAMVGLLVLPVLSLSLPGWRVLPAWAETSVTKPLDPSVEIDGIAGATIASDFDAAALGVGVPSAAPLAESARSSALWIPVALTIWLIGGVVLGLRLAFSRWALWRLGLRASACEDGKPLEILRELESALQIRRPVDLRIHPQRAMPMIWGIRRPRLLLPAASGEWTSGRLRAVLLHELAHVKRRDCLTQLFVQMTCAMHWFNPLVWVAARRVGVERERACDDLVLISGIRASEYAEHLLRIATGYGDHPGTVGAAALAMANPSKLEDRLSSILSRRIDRRSMTCRATILVACSLAVLALPVAMLRAVAQDENPAVPATEPAALEEIGELAEAWAIENAPVPETPEGDPVPDRQPRFERWFLGGAENLRGYDFRDAGPAENLQEQESAASIAAKDRAKPASSGNDPVAGEYPEEPRLDFESAKLAAEREALMAKRRELAERFGAKHPSMQRLDQRIRALLDKLGSARAAPEIPVPAPNLDDRYERLSEQFDEGMRAYGELRANGLGPNHPSVRTAAQRIKSIADSINALGGQPAVRDEIGTIAGIGVTLTEKEGGRFAVIWLLPDGPAARSGQIRSEDQIVAVAEGPAGAKGEWINAEGLQLKDLVDLLRGNPGDTVRLRIVRKEGDEMRTHEVALVRERLHIEGIPAGAAAPPGVTVLPQLVPVPVPVDPEPRAANDQPVLIALEKADASEAKKVIDGIIRASGRGRVIADGESNSLIFIGDAATLKLVRSAVEWLEP